MWLLFLPVSREKWEELGLRAYIIKAWLKWPHKGVLWNVTIEIDVFEQLDWDSS